MLNKKVLLWSCSLVFLALVIAAGGFADKIVQAADKVVTNCTDAGLRAALSGGGNLTFNCGTATIMLTQGELVISADTTIDGGGKITLSGNNSTRIFRVTYLKNLTLSGLTLRDANTSGGSTSADGGAAIKGDQGNLIVSTSNFLNNSYTAPGAGGGDWGGAIFWLGGSVTVDSSNFDGNKSFKSGGTAIHTLGANLTVRNSSFINNVSTDPGNGGAIYNDNVNGNNGFVRIEGSFFNNNSAQEEAGAIRTNLYNGGQYGIYDRNYFANNKVTKGASGRAHGGALRLGDGTFTVSNSIFDSNLAATQGGAIWTGETVRLKISNVEISNNVARTINPDGSQTGFGGGFAFAGNADSVIEIANATINNNSSGFIGGGIVHGNSGPLYLDNVTLTDNYAWWEGGGLGNGGANVFIRNSILAYNRTDRGGNNWAGKRNCNTTNHTNNGNNLQYSSVTDEDCAPGITRADPKLAALADNGGPNGKTRKPQSGSPAINAGNSNACALSLTGGKDQRGMPRADNSCDIGAFEIIAGPSIGLGFSTGTVLINQDFRLNYTLTNPHAATLTSVSFAHNLPAGLQISPTPAVTNNCAGVGTVNAPANGSSVNVSGVTLAANQSCVISVQVRATAFGTINTATSAITAKETEPGNGSNIASVTVNALTPKLTLAFAQSPVAAGTNATLQFTLANPNAGTLSGVALTQTLPSALKVVSANATACGGTVTATPGGSLVMLSSGTLAANVSCNFSVQVTSALAGSWKVSGGTLSASQSGSTTSGATATLETVVPVYSAVPLGSDNIFRVGATKPNTTNQAILTIKNSGHPVTSLSLSLVGQPSAPFAVTTLPTTLAGGASANLTVSCTPTTTGTVTGTLTLSTNSNGQSGTLVTHILVCAGGYAVTKPLDDGTSGTLSYVLNNQATQAGDAVIFDLSGTSTVTFSTPLTLTVKPGVTIDGGCSGGPSIRLDGTGQSTGLKLSGDNYLSGLALSGFSGQLLDLSGRNNRLFCTSLNR